MLQRKPQRNATYRRVFRRNLRIEIFERRDLLNTDWQNPFDARDTNTDGFISPIDALLVINTLNQSGSRVLSGMPTPDEAMFDVSGDNFVSPIDVLLVVNRLNAEGSGAVPGVIAESLAQAQTENTIPINAGLSSGTRTVFLDFQTYLTPSSATVASTDLLSVYVVDSAGTSTLLDRGELGTSVFSLSHNDSEIVPGLSTWNGSTLSVDVSILGDRADAKLKLQLLNGDGKQRSMVKLTGVRYESDATGTVNDIEVSQPLRVAAGQQLDTSLLSNRGNLRLDVSNTRYQSTSNEYAADLVIQNIGDAVGRQVVVALSGLPTGAQVLNASGTTASGQPYINFESATMSGGLGRYSQTLTIPVQIHNPNNQPLVLQPTILVGAPNAAPSLAPLGTVNVTPGQQVTVALNGSDTNGDKLTYILSNMTSGPHSMLLGNKLTIAPTPTEIGSYDLNVIVSDGVLTAAQPLRINVSSDTNTNTRVSGRVLDVDGTPLVGVVVEIGAVQALTQSDGRFLIDLGTSALLTDTIKIRGEQITGAATYPFIAEKLPLLLARDVYLGFNNVIDRPIYLPKLDMVNGKTIDPTTTTVVTTAAIPQAKVTVAAGTLMNQQGTPFTGQLSITEVPLERTPAAIPEGLFPDLVVTIQPGEMVFTVPTPISLPNRVGRLPGTILDLWSINPTTGQFEIVGQSKVSSDGLTVDTISGGIRNSSWHFVCPPIIGSTNNVSNGDNGCDECQVSMPGSSEVVLHSGALIETHTLPSYQSLGASREVSLVYDSERADPRPIFHVGFDSLALWDDFRLGAQIQMNVGATTFQSQGLESPLFPFAVGENVWKVPQEQTSASGAIQMDLADVPSGIYDYTASGKLVFGTRVVFSSFYEKQYLHVNSRDSVFGAGWGISGLKEAILNYDVTSAFGANTFVSDVLLVDGNGDENRFAGGNRDSNHFLSPPGDFSELSYDSVQRQLTHRMENGTVYKYVPVLAPLGQRPNKLQLVSMVDRNGNETRFEYSNGIGITSIVDPVGLKTSFEYMGHKVIRIVDPVGRVTNLAFEGRNLTTITDPDATQRKWQYDALSHMVGETTKRGFEQQATFDIAGRATHATREDGTEVSFNTLANRGVYPANQTTNVSDPPLALPFSNGTSLYRDGNGNPSEIVLDPRGQATARRDSVGSGSAVVRNSDNLVTRTFDARLNQIEYEHDENGNVIEIRDDIVLSDELTNPTITWSGAVSNDWSVPGNWIENRLPNATDDVLIADQGSSNPIGLANLIVQVRRLYSSLPLQLLNSTLKVTGSSRLSADVLMNWSALEIRGSEAQLLTIGELSSDSSTILVIGGAALNVSQYRVSGGFLGQNWVRSEGANSEIIFEQQSDDAFQSRGATFNAVSQGRIRFPRFTEVQFPGTLGVAGGGVIELNSVTAAGAILFSASSSGRIEARNLETVVDGAISISDTGVFPYAQLSNVDGTSITAEGGKKITIDVPSYRLSGFTSLLRARGAGSQLNFPNLASFIDETSAESNYAQVNAAMGGVVSLPLISATSKIQFAAESDGTIAVPLLTSVKNGLVEVSGNAQFPFGQLANIDSSSITAAGGAKLSLPLISNYVMPTSLAAFVARGVGSELRFPELGAITEPTLNRNNQLQVSAYDSGLIDIPRPQLTDGVYFTVATSGSILAPQLSIVSNGQINVAGNGQFPIGQLTNIDGSGISVTGGAKAIFSGITSYKLPFILSTLEARGAGSELQFPELVAFTDDDQSFSLNAVGFQAIDGGLLSAAKLSTLVKFGPNVTSSGTGSSVELPLVAATNENQFSVGNGGRIVALLLTSVRNGAITINGNGQFPISQLTNIDASNITAGAGAKLSFPLITRFKMAPSVSTFSANGAGAELHFPELTTILVNETTLGGSVNTQAFNGGIVTVAKLAATLKGAPQVLATGNGSRVEFPQVTATDGNVFTVNSGGQVVAPLLNSVKNGTIAIDGNGQFPIGQLMNIDGSSITASAGANLAFTGLQSLLATGSSSSIVRATGSGSLIQFPQLVSIAGKLNTTTSLQFVAENSASVNLPAAVNVRDVTLRATGAGSVIRVPVMTNAVNVTIQEQQGGLVNGPGEGESGGSSIQDVLHAGAFIGPLQVFPVLAISLANSPALQTEGERTQIQVLPQRFRFDPVFNQMVFESDGRGLETHYQIDPQNGNVLSMTRVVGGSLSDLTPFKTLLGDNVSKHLFADLDGDGLADLVYLRNGSAYVSMGASTSFSTATKISGSEVLSDLVLVDSNKDGKYEIFGTSTSQNSVLRWAHQSGSSFGTPTSFAVAGKAQRITAGDLDDDQDTDLVVLSDYGGGQVAGNLTVSVFQNAGLGQYSLATAAVVKSGTDAAIGVEAVDLDLDGNLDLVTQYSTSIGPNSRAGRIDVLWGNGSTNFVTGTLADRTAFTETEFSLRDVDNDGDLDLLGDGLFLETKPGRSSSVKEITASPGYYTSAAVKLRDLVFSDLDGNGAKDRISVFDGLYNQTTNQPSEGRLEIQLAKSSGVLGTPFSIPTGITPHDIAIQDLDGDGKLDLSFVSGTDNKIAVHFDIFGQQFGRIGDADDQITRYTYTPQGLIDTVIDPLGRLTDYDYDTFGRLITTTEVKGSTDEIVSRLEYDANTVGGNAGLPTATIDPNGNRSQIVYDSMNRVVQTISPDPDGAGPLASPLARFEYDAEGNLVKQTDAEGHVTTFEYDARNRRTVTVQPDPDGTGPVAASRETYAYDNNGNLVATTDPLGNVTRASYDARNRVIRQIDARGGETMFEYDRDNNMVALTDPVGNRTSFTYDSRNRMTSETDPLGKTIHYSYDGNDNLIEKIDRLGRHSTYGYDDLDRVVRETWVGDGNEIFYTYDLAGNLLNVRDEFSELTYTYDSLDRVSTVDNLGTPEAPRAVLQYSYDPSGNVRSVVDTISGQPGAQTDYAFDDLNRLIKLTQSGTGVSEKRVDFAYNQLGQYEEIGRFSDLAGTQPVVHTIYGYDGTNRLTAIDHLNSVNTPISLFHYRYDVGNRITWIDEIDGSVDYNYDTTDQLTGANYSDPTRTDESYRYDLNGNRLATHVAPTGYQTGPGNRLLSDGTYNYLYDAEGNMVRKSNIATGVYQEFEYDHRNRLRWVTQVLKGGPIPVYGLDVVFRYDATNRRISKSVDVDASGPVVDVVTHFIYDRESIILDALSMNQAGQFELVRYLQGAHIDEVFAQQSATLSVNWYLVDRIGSTRQLVDDRGSTLESFNHTGFGDRTSSIGLPRFLYTGREFDDEIDLYFYRSRFYDSSAGRFIQLDNIGFGAAETNGYFYVGNDPAKYRDPTGNIRWDGVAVGIAAEDQLGRGMTAGYMEFVFSLVSECVQNKKGVASGKARVPFVSLTATYLPKVSATVSTYTFYDTLRHVDPNVFNGIAIISSASAIAVKGASIIELFLGGARSRGFSDGYGLDISLLTLGIGWSTSSGSVKSCKCNAD